MHFEGLNAKKKLKKSMPTLPYIFRPVTRNTLIFLFGLMEWMLDRDSQLRKLLCCVLEQDALSAAWYWFNSGRQDKKHKIKQTKNFQEVPITNVFMKEYNNNYHFLIERKSYFVLN